MDKIGMSNEKELSGLIEKIKRLEEENRVLHVSDKIVETATKLLELSGQVPIGPTIMSMASVLITDLNECYKSREIYFLRQRVRGLEHDLREALSKVNEGTEPKAEYAELHGALEATLPKGGA